MKTTINIPDPLHRAAKQAALARGMTLGALIEEAIEAAIDPKPARKGKFKLPDGTFKGRPGLRPGIDFSDWSTIRDLIYEGRGS